MKLKIMTVLFCISINYNQTCLAMLKRTPNALVKQRLPLPKGINPTLTTFYHQLQNFKKSLPPKHLTFFKPSLDNYQSLWQQHVQSPQQNLDEIVKHNQKMQLLINNLPQIQEKINLYYQIKQWLKEHPQAKTKTLHNLIETYKKNLYHYLNQPHGNIDNHFYPIAMILQDLISDKTYQEHSIKTFHVLTKIEKLIKTHKSEDYTNFLNILKSRYTLAWRSYSYNRTTESLEKLEDYESLINKILLYKNYLPSVLELFSKVGKTNKSLQKQPKSFHNKHYDIIQKYRNSFLSTVLDPCLSNLNDLEKQFNNIQKLMLNPELSKLYELYPSMEEVSVYDLKTVQDISHTIGKEPEAVLRHFINKHTLERPVPICSQSKYQLADGNLFAYYHSLAKIIMLGREWYQMPPSTQLYTLFHEYRHNLQDIAKVLTSLDKNKIDKFYPQVIKDKAKLNASNLKLTSTSKGSWQIYEQDADHFAASHITCPTCLSIISCTKKGDPYDGYLSKEEIKPFEQAAKHNTPCPAHTLTTGNDLHNQIVQQLKELLIIFDKNQQQISQLQPTPFDPVTTDTKELINHLKNKNDQLEEKISELDKQSGSLLLHIPTFAQDTINAYNYFKAQQERLAQTVIDKIKEQTLKKKIHSMQTNIVKQLSDVKRYTKPSKQHPSAHLDHPNKQHKPFSYKRNLLEQPILWDILTAPTLTEAIKQYYSHTKQSNASSLHTSQ